MTAMDGAALEAYEDAWAPLARPDIPYRDGRWGANPYPAVLFLELLHHARGHLGEGAHSFCDLGAGVGGQVLRAQATGLAAWGVECVEAWAEAGRALGADVRTGYAELTPLAGTAIVYLNQLYQFTADQARLQAAVMAEMDAGAVLIAVNYATEPEGWDEIVHDPARRRGVWAKPS